MKGVRLMTQLPTWFNEMQTQAKALMPSLKLPKADRTNIKNWEFDFIESQTKVPQRICQGTRLSDMRLSQLHYPRHAGRGTLPPRPRTPQSQRSLSYGQMFPGFSGDGTGG